nr:MAG TPA: Metallo-beta-lactamase superfamily [Caudoviricetes sp.]
MHREVFVNSLHVHADHVGGLLTGSSVLQHSAIMLDNCL